MTEKKFRKNMLCQYDYCGEIATAIINNKFVCEKHFNKIGFENKQKEKIKLLGDD